MKKFLITATVSLAAFAATPAMAGGTHISVGLFTPAPVYYQPAPVYYQPAPVVYYPPVQHVYYAPPPRYYGPRYVAWDHGHHRGWHNRDYAWNDRRDDWHGDRGRH